MNTRPCLSEVSRLLHQTFLVHVAPGSTLPVELIEVRDLGARVLGGTRLDNYALLFRGGEKSHVPQAIYRIEHEVLGALDVFLVPVGPDEVGMRYEAIFN